MVRSAFGAFWWNSVRLLSLKHLHIYIYIYIFGYDLSSQEHLFGLQQSDSFPVYLRPCLIIMNLSTFLSFICRLLTAVWITRFKITACLFHSLLFLSWKSMKLLGYKWNTAFIYFKMCTVIKSRNALVLCVGFGDGCQVKEMILFMTPI